MGYAFVMSLLGQPRRIVQCSWRLTCCVNNLARCSSSYTSYFQISGVTLYSAGSSSYVERFTLQFSDDGTIFNTYRNQVGQDNVSLNYILIIN